MSSQGTIGHTGSTEASSVRRFERPRERPLLLAASAFGVAMAAAGGLMVLSRAHPAEAIVGVAGTHDAPDGERRRAGCLDCHVPFVGTPGSRCLGPGCHGELATGTPPRKGPAMPIRFHVALRGYACTRCHIEHRGDAEPLSFSHDLIPERARRACHRCHSGSGAPAHARTDSVPCDACHEASWRDAKARHDRVSSFGCDVCHKPPDNADHPVVAGVCTDCHSTSTWHPNNRNARTPQRAAEK
ncbi:MAG: hypothetical protein H6729_03400 [Deltaproteobacteria bacterium]|nr:hypothetical protein [Deltaproteobacteria bacterium]